MCIQWHSCLSLLHWHPRDQGDDLQEKVIPTNVGDIRISMFTPTPEIWDGYLKIGRFLIAPWLKISGDSWGHLPSNAKWSVLCYPLIKFHGCTRCKLWQSNIGWLEMFWFFHWKIHLHVYIHMCVLTNLRMLTLFFNHVRFHWRGWYLVGIEWSHAAEATLSWGQSCTVLIVPSPGLIEKTSLPRWFRFSIQGCKAPPAPPQTKELAPGNIVWENCCLRSNCGIVAKK